MDEAKVVRTVTTTVTRKLNLTVGEIEEVLLQHFKWVNNPGKVEWDEDSCGGIRGARIIHTMTSEEVLTDG
jgi:hypothetical protein